MHSKYLIIGSSHAALEAATAIRFHDPDGEVTLLTRDARLPYSPTILPYVVSGRSQPDKVVLRNATWFRDNAVAFVPGATVVAIDPAQSLLRLDSGETWTYERLLIATGATPALPPVRGLADIPFHVLRSMDDAIELRNAIGHAKSAIVLGAGLIGMHAAENMAKAGVAVSVIEMQRHVLSAYFEPRASTIIEGTFARNGVRMVLGRTLAKVDGLVDRCIATLDDGRTIVADLLLVCTGVKPNIAFLDGSGIDVDVGILVDDRMRTNLPNIWAAGDVAQAQRPLGRKGRQRHSAECGRTGPHRRARHGGRFRGCAVSRRGAAQHLQLLRPAGDLGRRRQGRHRMRDRGAGRRTERRLSPHRPQERQAARHRHHQ